ncbi:DoxX protein [Marinicauda salina]|uniref:DoxX protein n=1 Tax=Marinicauda salina TaxID=2135793 RepID=A0A2U2BRR7_9PROT|nr:DoxX protein [Marinicauda salina]PWE16679.1 DoxX protein [Marinicauda salina]
MKLQVSLFVMRLTMAAFFAVWAVEKILHPDRAASVFEAFYGISNLPAAAAIALGAIQLGFILAFLFVGRFRFVTVGGLLVMHAVSTASSWSQLINPYEGGNHLFWAAVPTLGALIALFLLRDEDRLYMVGR